jgi:hypothetical protein
MARRSKELWAIERQRLERTFPPNPKVVYLASSGFNRVDVGDAPYVAVQLRVRW